VIDKEIVMKVEAIMTKNPACCTPETSLRDVSQMMMDNDCGCIPVVESKKHPKLVGVITDRDIVGRSVAQGRNPLDLTAVDCMTRPVVTTTPQTTVQDCCRVMEENQIRRIMVVDGQGHCQGIVAQADIAMKASEETTGQVVQEISQPTSVAQTMPQR
jgi:CBS domain-containing protein